MAVTIDTLANVKNRLGITAATDDTLLNNLMESASRVIEKHVGGRTFPASPAANITEYFPGNSRVIVVKRPPISSGTPSIKIDAQYAWGTDITALTENTDYRVDTAAGIIYSLCGDWIKPTAPMLASLGENLDYLSYVDAVRVVYTGDGVADEAVKEALALLVLKFYSDVKGDVDQQWRAHAFDSRSSIQTQRRPKRFEETLPPMVKYLLMPYRRPVV